MATHHFVLSIDCENAAFSPEDNGESMEIARILRQLADDVEGLTMADLEGGKLRDANGNHVGSWGFENV